MSDEPNTNARPPEWVAPVSEALSDRLHQLEGVTEKPMWGEQGYLRGNRVFARWRPTPDGITVSVKVADGERERLAGQTGVEPHPNAALSDAGWVQVQLRSAEALDEVFELVRQSHAQVGS